eukprot:15436646-Alexandrium_andersonii.AAC.1
MATYWRRLSTMPPSTSTNRAAQRRGHGRASPASAEAGEATHARQAVAPAAMAEPQRPHDPRSAIQAIRQG